LKQQLTQKPLVSVPESTITPASNLTTNWKIYTDDEFDFSFRYPSAWFLEVQSYDDNESKVFFIDASPINIPTSNEHRRIGLVNIQVHHSNPDYIKKNRALFTKGQPVAIGEERISAYRIEEITAADDLRTGMQDIHYNGVSFIQQNEYIYTLSIQAKNTEYEEYKAIFDQILSTFKFTDSTDTSNWKTFSDDLGYSFLYPPSYQVSTINSGVVLRSTEAVDADMDNEFALDLFILRNDNQLGLKDFILKKEGVVNGRIPASTEYEGSNYFRNIITFEEKIVGGKDAYLFHADPCSICRGETYITYIKLSPKTILAFDLFIDQDKEAAFAASYKVYDKILSTLRFD
jgi:hypothetical protein